MALSPSPETFPRPPVASRSLTQQRPLLKDDGQHSLNSEHLAQLTAVSTHKQNTHLGSPQGPSEGVPRGLWPALGVAQQLGFACGPERAAVAVAASLRPQASSLTTSSCPLQLSADTRGIPQASPCLAAHRSPLSPQAGPPVSSDPRHSRCLADTAVVARSTHTDSGPTMCQA